MPILTDAELEADRQKIAPVPHMIAGAEPHPYLLLAADDFERLVCSLFQISASPGQIKDWDRASLMIRGADAGRDVVLFRLETVTSVVQCKRLDQAMALPAVFRELAKLVLYPSIDATLPRIASGMRYVLVVARDPAGTVVDFFDRPKIVITERANAIAAAVDEVLETYTSLAAVCTAEQAAVQVMAILPTLEYVLIRPHQLDSWLIAQPTISSQYFRQRFVTDNSLLEERTAQILAKLGAVLGQTAGVGLLTDEDLKIIKARIEQTPPSHRANFGFAATFGFPREMFSGDANLKLRAGRLMTVLQEMHGDYTNWLFDKSNALADEISDAPEGKFSHPYVRQLPRAFLGYVTRDILQEKLNGAVLGAIIAKASGQTSYSDDEARLAAAREALLAQGQRYLAGDFSHMVGNPDLVTLKREVVQELMQGLSSENLERALDTGIAAMKPRLLDGAANLRKLGAYKPSIFLMGVDAIEDSAVVKLMADTVRELEAARKGL